MVSEDNRSLPLDRVVIAGQNPMRNHANNAPQHTRRGTTVRAPYALDVNSTFARYDALGREKPAAIRSRGHSPAGMQGIICVGHGSGALNPAFKLSPNNTELIAQIRNINEPHEGSIGKPYVTLRTEDVYNDAYAGSAFPEGKVFHAKPNNVASAPNSPRLKKRPTTAINRSKPMEVVKPPDIGPVPTEAEPTDAYKPTNVKATTSSTLDAFTENHATKLSNYFCQLYMHDQLTDVLVHIGSYSFSAHKTMLCCFSPYLQRIILQSPEVTEIFLCKSITPTGFKKILDYIYTKELSIEVENLAEILQAATVLNMPDLNDHCRRIIESANIAVLLDILETSHKQGLQTVLKSMMIPKISANFRGIYKLTEFLDLCQDCVCEILDRDDLVAKNEMEVMKAAVSWVKYNGERSVLLEKICACVRLENMSSNELVKLGQDIPMLIENDVVQRELLKAHWNANSSELKLESSIALKPKRPRSYTANKTASNVPSKPHDTKETTSVSLSSKTSSLSQSHGRNESDSFQKHHVTHTNNNNSIALKSRGSARSCEVNASIYAKRYKSDPILDMTYLSRVMSSEFSDMSFDTIPNVIPEAILNSNQNIQHLNNQKQEVNTISGYEKVNNKNELMMKPTNSLPLSLQELAQWDPFPVSQKTNYDSLLFYTFSSSSSEEGHGLKMLNTLTNSTKLCAPLPYNIVGHQIVYNKPHVYLIGGCVDLAGISGDSQPIIRPLNNVWRLHLSANIWAEMPAMNYARYLASAVSVRERLYVIGGIDDRLHCTRTVEYLELRDKQENPVWDFDTCQIVLIKNLSYKPKWRQVNDLPYPRFGAAACVCNTSIFLAGGASSLSKLNDDCIRSSVYQYETTTDTWSRVAHLKRPRFRPVMAATDDAIFIAGGMTSVDRFRFARRVEMYDTKRKEWKKMGDVKCRRTGGFAFTDGQKLWLAGGMVFAGNSATPEEMGETETVSVL